MKTTSLRQVIVAMAIAVTAATVHGAWFASADATTEGAPVASIRMAEWDHYEQKWLATIIGDGETLRHSEGAIFELRSQSGGAVSLSNVPAGLTIETLDAEDLEALDIPLPSASNLIAFAPLTTVPVATGPATYIRLAVSSLEVEPDHADDVLQTRPQGHVGPWAGPLTPTDTDRAALDVGGSVGEHSDVEFSDGGDTVTFSWDIGRWAKGDLFVGMNQYTYRVLDRTGEFKRFVASADIDDPDSAQDYNITAGCAANWQTGEVFATNFADLSPAINVITRHPSSGGRSLYSPADRRISTITSYTGHPDAEMPVDINPESVVFDGQMNMYVGHSDSFLGPVTTNVFDQLTLNHPTLYDADDDWYFLDVNGWPLSYSDGNSYAVIVDETGGVLELGTAGLAPFVSRRYGIDVSMRLKYNSGNLILSPLASVSGLGLPALMPETYMADPQTGQPLMEQGGSEIAGRWPMGRRIHRYNVQPDGTYRGANTDHPGGPDRNVFWAATARFGTDWIDLDASGDVVYYTSEDSLIHRYRVRPGINNDPIGQLPDVGLGQLLPGEDVRLNAMRILPPGDGSGGFLAAGEKAIYRFGPNGALVQKFQIGDDPYLKSLHPVGSVEWENAGEVRTWYAMEVDPNGKTFWASSNDSGWIYQFDIATGRETRRVEAVEYLDVDTDPELPEGRVIGSICVMWEYTAPQEVCFAADGSPDGNDDDGDGVVDENCSAIEICNNVVDDDGDSLPDNNDPDCGAEEPPVAVPDAYITDQNVDLTVPSVGTEIVLNNDTDPDNGIMGEPWRTDTLTVASFGASTPDLAPGSPLVTASGTVTLAEDGSFLYDPAPTFHGQFTFVYTVTDGVSNSAPTTVTITVRPLVANDTYVTTKNTPLTGNNVLVNDSIAPMFVSAAGADTITSLPGQSITFQTTHGGTVTINSDGTFVYTPAEDFAGVDTFVYLGYDGNSESVTTATVTITVSDVNAVVAVNDGYTTPYNTPTTQNLLGNDSDPQNDVFQLTHVNGQPVTVGSIVSVALPDNKTATVLVNTVAGSVTITPPVNFWGTITFPYTIQDTATTPATSSAEVTVWVSAPGTFGLTNDVYTTMQNTPISVPVGTGILVNDDNFDLPVVWIGGAGPHLPLNGAPVTGPTSMGGTVVVRPDGSIFYTPALNFVGEDVFLYGVLDWSGVEFRANVTITVLPVNRPPVAVDDSATTERTTPVTIAVLPNDSDPDNDTLTVVPDGFTQPTGGTVTLNGSVFTFVANDGFTGTTTFTYTISDGHGGTAVATVTVLVTTPVCGVVAAPAVALVRTQSTFDGTLRGSVQLMQAVGVTLNSSAVITGDLMMPGTPNIVNNGTPNYNSVFGTGATTPTNHQFIFNSGASLGRLVRRTDAVALPTVDAPPSPTGSRYVTMNSPSDDPGDFGTLRSLTLNSNVGPVAVPAGTYDNFTANSGSAFVIGVAGATTPSVYNFQQLTLNSNSSLQVVGPVVVTVRNSMSFNGPVGAASNPEWFTLRVSNGDVTLNSNVPLYGYVEVPNGRVTINGGAILKGGLAANALTINSGGVLELMQGESTPCPADVIIKIDDKTKIYGDADPTLTYQVISGGPLADGSLTGTISREAGQNVGQYVIGQGTLAPAGDFTLEVIPGTLTVTPRPAIVRAGSGSKVFGTVPDPALSVISTSGFLAADESGIVLTQSRDAGEGVGTYLVNALATGAVTDNYDVDYVTGLFEITKAPSVSTPTGGTFTYDGTSRPQTCAVTGAGGQALAGGAVSYSPGGFIAPKGVGTYTVTCQFDGDANHLASTGTATVVINPKAAVVTAGSASKTYGSTDPTLSPVTTSGFSALDLITLVLSQTRVAGENVGSYATTPTALGAILGNYSVTYLPGALTINPKPLTVEAHDKTRPVGQPNPTLDGVWTGLVAGDVITATYATPATAASPAGSYVITPTPVDPNNRLGNYILTIIPGTLTVTPVSTCSATGYLTYSQGGWGSKPSGNNPGAFLAANFSTVYPGGSVQIGGTKKLTFTSAAAIAAFLPQGGSSNVLTSNATNPTSSSAGNFAAQLLAMQLAADFSEAGVTKSGLGTLVMQSGPLAGMTVDAILAMANTVIGGTTSALPSGMSMSTLSGILETLNMNYHEGTANQGLLGCGGSTPCSATQIAFTGNSSVTGTAGNIRTFSEGGVSVNASAFSRVKGSNGSWATAYLGVWSEGLGVTDTSENGSSNTHKLDNNGRLNYILFEFSQPVVITKAFLDSISSDSDATIWVGTKVNPFTSHLTLSDAVLSSLGSPETSTGGSSDRWAEFNGSDVTGNVLVIAADIGSSNDSFKVSKLQIDCASTPEEPEDPEPVAPTIAATGGTFVYSGAAQAGTCTVTGANNAPLTGTLSYSPGSSAPTQVGTYTATCAFAGNATYSAASATATITITPRPATVSAGFGTKVYGTSADPALSAVGTSGFLSADLSTIGLSQARAAGQTVGTYPTIAAATGAVLSNYSVTYAPGTFTITPAPLTVVANDKTKTQGSANPTLNGTLTGVVAGDTITATYSTTATTSSPVGSYAIVPALVDSGNKLSNYAVTKTNGTLTVTANTPPCSVSQFTMSGSSSTYGTAGNIRTFTSGSVSMKASAFSRTKSSNGTWATAYLGVWSEGLGVTDGAEGTGGNNTHKTDNVDRLNFVLLEFSQPVVVTRAYLNSISTDSDATIWVGTANNPYTNHLTLSDAVLAGLGSAQSSSGGSSARWATFNGSAITGNVVVIAADVNGSNDQFKVNKLTVTCPQGAQAPEPAVESDSDDDDRDNRDDRDDDRDWDRYQNESDRDDDDDDRDGRGRGNNRDDDRDNRDEGDEDHDCREHGSDSRDCDHERGRNGHHDGDRCDHERDSDYRRSQDDGRGRSDDRGRGRRG